jgi:hypothetical protein
MKLKTKYLHFGSLHSVARHTVMDVINVIQENQFRLEVDMRAQESLSPGYCVFLQSRLTTTTYYGLSILYLDT